MCTTLPLKLFLLNLRAFKRVASLAKYASRVRFETLLSLVGRSPHKKCVASSRSPVKLTSLAIKAACSCPAPRCAPTVLLILLELLVPMSFLKAGLAELLDLVAFAVLLLFVFPSDFVGLVLGFFELLAVVIVVEDEGEEEREGEKVGGGVRVRLD